MTTETKQQLFNYLANNHDAVLLATDLIEIERIIDSDSQIKYCQEYVEHSLMDKFDDASFEYEFEAIFINAEKAGLDALADELRAEWEKEKNQFIKQINEERAIR